MAITASTRNRMGLKAHVGSSPTLSAILLKAGTRASIKKSPFYKHLNRVQTRLQVVLGPYSPKSPSQKIPLRMKGG